MALLDSEGFGLSLNWNDYLTYGLFTTSGGSTSGAPSMHAGGMYGDNYLSMWNETNHFYRAAPIELGTFLFGARTRLGGANPGGSTGYVFADASFNTHFTVRFTPDGMIAIRASDNTLRGSSAVLAIPVNGWQWVEVQGVIDPSAGAVVVRVNGVVVLNLTGINTKSLVAGAGATMRRYGILAPGAGPGCTTDTQHWYLCDNTGAAPWNTFLGDVRVMSLYPTADDAVQFTPNGDPTNHANVARVPPVPFTDFNSSATVGNQDTFAMTQVDASTPVILGVHNKPLLYKNDPGAREAEAILKSGATTDVGPSNVLSDTAKQLLRVHQVDPNTGIQWTLANVNLIKAGYRVSA